MRNTRCELVPCATATQIRPVTLGSPVVVSFFQVRPSSVDLYRSGPSGAFLFGDAPNMKSEGPLSVVANTTVGLSYAQARCWTPSAFPGSSVLVQDLPPFVVRKTPSS